MKSFRKYLIIVFALVLALSATITAYGASGGKTTYLVTKIKYREYDTDQKTIKEKAWTKYKYNKNGLLKSVSSSPDEYGFSMRYTFVYNSKKQAIRINEAEYCDGKKVNLHCRKLSYDKNGYVSREKVYWIDNGRYELCCETILTWNKKGLPTKIRECDDKGKTDSITWYKYNKEGQLTRSRHYDADDKSKRTTWYKYNKKGQIVKEYYNDSPICTIWTYDGDKVTVTQYEDKSKDLLAFITYETYEHGNIIKEVQYSGRDGTLIGEDEKYKHSICNYEYKKVKLSSKNRKLVRKQQAFLDYLGI